MRLLLAALISLLIPLNAVASVTGLSLEGLMSPENMLSGRYGTPTPPPGSSPTSGGDLTGQFSVGLLFEDIGEDRFLTLDIRNQLEVGPLKFGLQVPISLRVWDEDPQDVDTVRTEAWDEISDFAQIVRFLELNLGDETWGFRGRLGALDGESIGHGTILAGYFNSIDRDHYQGGIALRAGFGFGGAELMVDNLLAPEIIGSRLFLRPAAWFSDADWAQNLVFGMSFVTDTNAPLSLKNGSTKPSTDFEPVIDPQGNLVATDKQSVDIVGFDLEYTVMKNALVDIVPYVDLNVMRHTENGVGFHAGSFFNLKIPGGVGPTVMTRLEYRYAGENYAPRYIDSLYEAHRLMFVPANAGSAPQTKLNWLKAGGHGNHGWLGELFFDFAGWVKLGGSYEDYEGPNNSALTLNLLLPRWETLQAGALYTHRGFDSLSEAFQMDGALLLAFLKSQVWGPVYATASYSRSWTVNEGGTYTSQDDWNIGVGLDFSY